MFRYSVFALTVAVSPLGAAPVDLIPGRVSYDVPARFEVTRLDPDTGDGPVSIRPLLIKLSSSAGGYHGLDVSIRTVGVTIGDGKRVTTKPVLFEELHQMMATTVTSSRATNSPRVEEFQFAGHRALRLKQVVWIPNLGLDGGSLIFEHVWVPLDANRVLEVTPVGRTEELLKSVWDSLSTFKIIAPSPAQEPSELPIARDVARLGDVRADVARAAGKAVDSGPSTDLYYTGKYFAMISYRMPKVTHITYVRASDPNKYAAAIKELRREELMTFKIPLPDDDIQALLSHHSRDVAGSTLTWKSTATNRWQRSDGARAGYNPARKALTVATEAIWPNLMDVNR